MNTQEMSRTELVDAIKAATSEVFSTMLNMEISSSGALENPSAPAKPSGLVSLIGMAGNWAGTGSIACTGTFACKMASGLLMTPYDAVSEDVLDAVGEITNMVIGNVKTAIEEKLGPMGLSTPTVIFGLNFQTYRAPAHEWISVTFHSGNDHLTVQLCLKPNDNSGKVTLRPGFQIPQVLSAF